MTDEQQLTLGKWQSSDFKTTNTGTGLESNTTTNLGDLELTQQRGVIPCFFLLVKKRSGKEIHPEREPVQHT